ncbi:MAG: hypothetical protein ABI781_01875 [Burkholderiales bacterium]
MPVPVLAKQGLRHARGDLVERDAVALKQRVRLALVAPADFEEGLTAFARKRPALWVHR